MRHAQAYWLRIQANAAVLEAMHIDEPSDDWVCGNPVENALDIDEPGMKDLMKLQMAHAAASLEAGRILYHMERLHREIVRRGGRP